MVEKAAHISRVLIADSMPAVRDALIAGIGATPDLHVVGEADEGYETIWQIRHIVPDLAIVERELPSIDGMHVLATLFREGLPTRLLLLARYCPGRDVLRALELGASAYLSKHQPVAALIAAMRAVAAGERVLSPEAEASQTLALADQSLERQQSRRKQPASDILTKTELDILTCIANGLSISATAQRLHISVSTVKNHRHNLFDKLGVSNAPAAVYRAVQMQLL